MLEYYENGFTEYLIFTHKSTLNFSLYNCIMSITVVYSAHNKHAYIHAEYILTQWIKTSKDFFKKNIPLTLLKGCVCERELETEQNCNILNLTLMAISIVSVLFSRTAQPEVWGPSLSGICSHSSILSLTHLISNSLTSCLHRVI